MNESNVITFWVPDGITMFSQHGSGSRRCGTNLRRVKLIKRWKYDRQIKVE
jgi:hypothetical protein